MDLPINLNTIVYCPAFLGNCCLHWKSHLIFYVNSQCYSTMMPVGQNGGQWWGTEYWHNNWLDPLSSKGSIGMGLNKIKLLYHQLLWRFCCYMLFQLHRHFRQHLLSLPKKLNPFPFPLPPWFYLFAWEQKRKGDRPQTCLGSSTPGFIWQELLKGWIYCSKPRPYQSNTHRSSTAGYITLSNRLDNTIHQSLAPSLSHKLHYPQALTELSLWGIMSY